MKTKHIIIFTFYTKNDYNSRIIKIILFLFSIALYFRVNILFLNVATMHKISEDNGRFNLVYQIPQIFYSTIINVIINIIIKYLSLTEKNILKIKEEKKDFDKIKSKLLNYSLYYLILFIMFL